jgi:hypothetical protein
MKFRPAGLEEIAGMLQTISNVPDGSTAFGLTKCLGSHNTIPVGGRKKPSLSALAVFVSDKAGTVRSCRPNRVAAA